MITINEHLYTGEEIEELFHEMDQLEAYSSCGGKIFMVCSNEPIVVLAAVMYLRSRNASVLLLHGDTPHETALALAREAGCDYAVIRLYKPLALREAKSGPAASSFAASLYQFSSGTTGRPKLIGRAWTELELEIQMYNRALRASPDEVPLIMVPLAHSFGLITGTLSALERGAAPVVISERNPKFAARILRSYPKSILYTVPFLLHLLCSLHATTVNLHKVVCSGAPLPESLFRQLRSLSVYLLQQYGCTELGCISLSHEPDSVDDVGKVLDHLEAGIQEVEPGWGEVVIHSSRGSICTNDIGFLDSEGRLHIRGRKDDLINVAGQKVIPGEVEEVICLMPQVAEALVYAGRHPVWGQSVKALVTLKQPEIQLQDTAIPDHIRSWCHGQLPAFKVPGEIRIVEMLPRTATGKITRKGL
ncbi:MAG: acyl-CoA synthetase [Paenibacillaceae bacterium]|jgi:fatty-acyl-CoA synthase|nr:acyl-CoA synthetase [Paenibacillaceae bacterium]